MRRRRGDAAILIIAAFIATQLTHGGAFRHATATQKSRFQCASPAARKSDQAGNDKTLAKKRGRPAGRGVERHIEDVLEPQGGTAASDAQTDGLTNGKGDDGDAMLLDDASRYSDHPQAHRGDDTHVDEQRLAQNNIVEVKVAHEDADDPERELSIHERILQGKEFQLHIPPIANFKPTMRQTLTKPETYTQLVTDAPKQAHEQGDYVEGPLDILNMVKSGQLPDFRHGDDTEKMKPGEANLFTWKVERPPDIFILNWSGVVNMGFRDGVVTAAKAILDMTQNQPKETLQVLQMIANDNKLPIWLATRARYAQPYIDTDTDWIPALQYFINNCNEQDMLERDHRLDALADTQAKPLDIIKHVTEQGDPNRIVDMAHKQREDMKIETYELDGWKHDGERYSDGVPTYQKLIKQLGVHDEELERLYNKAREQLRQHRDEWHHATFYRTNCKHLDEKQRQNHEAFNCAVLSAIKHHLEVFQLPVYLLSDIKTTEAVRQEMEALGIKPADDEHVYGREKGTVADNVKQILRKLNVDHRIPVHCIDDRLRNLKAIHAAEELEHVRTYFVDWGRSTWNEKLGALYDDGVKYVKTSEWIVKFMATISTTPGREWTHGFRLRRPDEEAGKSLLDWKKRWHKLPQYTETPQRPMLKIS